MTNPNAICGNCGGRYSEHFDSEPDMFCWRVPGMAVFTSEPSPRIILDFMSQRIPAVVQEMVELWRKENGHE